jgi:DNA segregation ATPase FtsK/SpoIIIE, S-DNA-T family
MHTYKGMFRARVMAAAGSVGSLTALVAAAVFWLRATTDDRALAVLVSVVGLACLAFAVMALPMSGLLFEAAIRHRFHAVCRERRLATKVSTSNGHRWLYPSFGQLSGSSVANFEITIRPLLGQSFADWERSASAFTMAYGATATRLVQADGGRVVMTVGYQHLDAHDFEHLELTYATDDALPWRERLRQLEVGKGEGGRPVFLPLLGSHILIAGITGAGKGSVQWSMLLRLVPAAEAGVVRFWGFDPKRMELAIGRGFFGDRYAADTDALVVLLKRVYGEMLARADELAGKVRKFEPSRRHPLEVLVVDELGYLVALIPDRKQREEAEKMLSAVLVLGRAVGFAVIGALQDPRKETLSFRDLFPTRVAMRLPKPMVDLVLGHGMYEAGAQCDLIPATEADGAGVAFVVDETSTRPVMIRAPWCSDDAIRAASARLEAPPFRRLSAVQ